MSNKSFRLIYQENFKQEFIIKGTAPDTISQKNRHREQIKKDILNYLCDGGRIHKIPYGVTKKISLKRAPN